jgi:hypothetical protein
MGRSRVAVLKTAPATVIDDFKRLMRLADYQQFLPKEDDSSQNQYQLALLLSGMLHHAMAA